MIYCTADWHLDKRQYGLEKREEDFYKSANDFIAKAIPGSKILNAGDIFDSNRPRVRALYEVKKINDALAEKQCIMYYIEGNHDKSNPHYIDLLATGSCYGIKLLRDGEINDIGNNTNLIGFSEQPKGELLSKIASLNLQELTGKSNILMLHISCRDFCDGFFSEHALSFSEIPNIDYFDYVIIGDTHVHNKVKYKNTMMLSPGSLEMVSSAEDYKKSVFAINLKTKAITDLPVETRQCFKSTISTNEDIDKFMEAFTNDVPKQNAIMYITINKCVIGINRILELEKVYDDIIFRIKYVSDTYDSGLDDSRIQDDALSLIDFSKIYFQKLNIKNDIVEKILDNESTMKLEEELDNIIKKYVDNE